MHGQGTAKDLTMTYRNKNTGELRQLVRVETIKSFPENITVYVLDDGTRWERSLFYEHWVAA